MAIADGAGSGLALVDTIAAERELDGDHLLHSARADVPRRMGLTAQSAVSYERALALAANESERHFLSRRLSEVRPV